MEPFDPMCERFAKDMTEYDYFLTESQEEYDEFEKLGAEEKGKLRKEYVEENEGTFNDSNGHFLCDECYIKAGMPSRYGGWVCP